MATDDRLLTALRLSSDAAQLLSRYRAANRRCGEMYERARKITGPGYEQAVAGYRAALQESNAIEAEVWKYLRCHVGAL